MNSDSSVNRQRWKSDNHQNPEEQKTSQSLRDAGTKRDEKIHLFRRMMRRMRRPHNIYRMSPTMHPVKNKIDAKQKQNRRKPIYFDREKPEIFIQITVADKHSRRDQNVHRLVAERGSEICDRFAKCYVGFFVIPAEKYLQKNEEQCDRCYKGVNVCFLHVFLRNIAQKSTKFNVQR